MPLVFSLTYAQNIDSTYKGVSPLKFRDNAVAHMDSVDLAKRETLWNQLEKQILNELEKSPTNPYLHKELKRVKQGKDSLYTTKKKE